MSLTLPRLASQLKTEADAYEFVERLRWNGPPVCPHCGGADPYFLTPKDGTTRRTTRGTRSQRRVWKCRECRKQFSVLTGTIFHGTKIRCATGSSLCSKWPRPRTGSRREIQRKYGLSSKSAWFMMHRIREAMKRDPMAGLLEGRIVVDETYIGGKPSNRHGTTRSSTFKDSPTDPGRRSRVRDTGEVRSKVLPNVTGDNLLAAIKGEVKAERAVTHTDGSFRYPRIAHHFAGHESVNHEAREWARGDITTNQVLNDFSQLKRSIDGTHHRVSVPHLQRYLAEFDFRYTHRKDTDTERMARLLSRVAGRRLRYKEPTGPDRVLRQSPAGLGLGVERPAEAGRSEVLALIK